MKEQKINNLEIDLKGVKNNKKNIFSKIKKIKKSSNKKINKFSN